MNLSPDLRGRTILIVDDIPANLTLAVDMLEQQGLRLSVAQCGDEALQRVAFALPDLILLDVRLPGIDGFEVCRRLKSGGANATRCKASSPHCATDRRRPCCSSMSTAKVRLAGISSTIKMVRPRKSGDRFMVTPAVHKMSS